MLKSKTTPPFDSKFIANSENGVIFQIEGAKFRDIEQYVQHGRFETQEAYGCQRVNIQSDDKTIWHGVATPQRGVCYTHAFSHDSHTPI